jgi:P-type Ca2+ transporter type 2C
VISSSVTGSGYTPQGDFLKDQDLVDIKDYPVIKTALWLGTLNNDAQLEPAGEQDGRETFRMIGDPTEGAILVAALKTGASIDALNQSYPRAQEIPFDSVRKRMLTIHEVESPQDDDISPMNNEDGERDLYFIDVKGAPDVVLGLCTQVMTSNDHNQPLTDGAAY